MSTNRTQVSIAATIGAYCRWTATRLIDVYRDPAAADARRYRHCENLRPAQLSFLNEIRITHYDPCFAPELSPRLLRETLKGTT